ncbi:unnamed protein product [Acanthoscelides obtectus]|uniref:Integrase catalytic domain-containing protein n=1 Tax=Acanthoscelides obtectus TaxID=200917 RepID=A0A9P0LRJ4_ACAOB|nr:unnamed protein product [Acanthoscelides obtectus]CAK1627137.1 hypothetical protein AOBTE_LOCUS4334 [Acanthoscelides obtectus]
MKPPQFDGITSWNVYRRQFEAAANANGWSSTKKATALTLALRGDAAAILQRISPEEQEAYEQLVGHLELRYGQSYLGHVYHTQLKNRFQKSGESLQEFEADIARVSHPQSNVSMERFHATVLEMIRTQVSENPNEHPFNILQYAVPCYNSTRNKITGFTPYELVFGHTSGRPPEHVYLEKELMSKYLRDIRNKLEYYYKIAHARTDEQKQKAKFLLTMQTTKEKYSSKTKASAADHDKQYSNVVGKEKNDAVSLRTKKKP